MAMIRKMELTPDMMIRKSVLIRLNRVKDSMKNNKVTWMKIVKMVNLTKGAGALFIPGTNPSNSSFSKNSPINDLRNIATNVMAAAFMPGVLRKISMISPMRKAEMIT
jgi:hypothetical protein